jgi:transaldolase/glucose-6-phosphate isomerase
MSSDEIQGQTFSLGHYESKVADRLKKWQEEQVARRIWDKDFTVWAATHLPEITDRLGWLHLPETMRSELGGLNAFADEIKTVGPRHIVLLGMGGSSLAPEVFQATFGSGPGRAELIVLDSTHPRQVKAVASRVDPRRALFIVASKGGTTIETISLFKYFFRAAAELTGNAGRHFVATTDAGSPLESLAAERGMRRTFIAPADVGGRYSALTQFGLLPAALIGVDIDGLLKSASAMADACGPSVPAADNPGLALGAALGELALAGRDKVTFVTSASLAAFPSWLEQLIAESTGKNGRGIVPVVDEPLGRAQAYGPDRVFVHIGLAGGSSVEAAEHLGLLEAAGHPVIRIVVNEKIDLGGEIFRWELAVAGAGSILGINPFDQPDVRLAKDLSRDAMAEGASNWAGGREPALSVERKDKLAGALDKFLSTGRRGDYLGIQAYLAPAAPIRTSLEGMRPALRDKLRVATTLGFGPRFLHSTGQLHKGGPNTGLFLQLVDTISDDLTVPETDYTFGRLVSAQSSGDFQALQLRKRRVLRIALGRDAIAGLEKTWEVLSAR